MSNFDFSIILAGVTILSLSALRFAYNKDKFALIVSTNSGEIKAIVSEDKEYITDIVDCLNDAIIYRG